MSLNSSTLDLVGEKQRFSHLDPTGNSHINKKNVFGDEVSPSILFLHCQAAAHPQTLILSQPTHIFDPHRVKNFYR